MFLSALLATSLAAPVPKAKAELFYPTQEGAKRVLEMKRGDETIEMTVTVVKVETKDDVHTVAVDVGEGVTAFTVSARGLARRGPQGNGPAPLLKLDVKEGETWEYELEGPGGKTERTTYTLGKREEVEVPAGKFQAVRVDSETSGNGTVWRTTSWYAPGVGLVKLEAGKGKRRVTQELKEFTPGK